ncbi:MAG: YafY family protein [Cytophagales bacterium]|nr:YafY family protein [Cytophagales bacterium]
MNRIDRLTAILVQLQTRRKVTMDHLEERFDLSRRSLFRDIRALLEIGIPIGGDAGEGYFIAEGYHLPPVVFNKEEAAALLLGSKFIEKQADSKVNDHLEDALSKVKAVLRTQDRDFLESLENHIEVIPPPSVSQENMDNQFLSDIQFALSSSRTLHFGYWANSKQEFTEREVEPLSLVYYTNHWHLIAYCQLRQELRDFRTDRIQKLKVTDHSYDRSQHPEHQEFLGRSMHGADAKEAVIWFSNEVANFLGEQKFWHGFVKQEEADGGMEMHFSTPSYHFLGRWLLSYGTMVKIIEPQELKDLVRGFVVELSKHHE